MRLYLLQMQTIFGVDMMLDGMDMDGDGKVAPWERLCFYVIAGCVAIALGQQYMF